LIQFRIAVKKKRKKKSFRVKQQAHLLHHSTNYFTFNPKKKLRIINEEHQHS